MFVSLMVLAFLHSYLSIRRQLNNYIENDFSRQSGWGRAKTMALEKGTLAGYDLERLSTELYQSEASVRSKLVSMNLYNTYKERQIEDGAQKFKEWQSLNQKLGLSSDLNERRITEGEKHPPIDWKFVQSLVQNLADNRIELCESFFTSSNLESADPVRQHEVFKHIAAFLNTAGGYVLIGFNRGGKILGLFDDDFRTPHIYRQELMLAIKKTLGPSALTYCSANMVKWGSEDICLLICQKANTENEDISCVDRNYNQLEGFEKSRALVYRRVDGASVFESVHDLKKET